MFLSPASLYRLGSSLNSQKWPPSVLVAVHEFWGQVHWHEMRKAGLGKTDRVCKFGSLTWVLRFRFLGVFCILAFLMRWKIRLYKAAVLSLDPVDIWGQIIICCGGRLVASLNSTHQMPVARPWLWQLKVSTDNAKCPLGARIAVVENNCVKVMPVVQWMLRLFSYVFLTWVSNNTKYMAMSLFLLIYDRCLTCSVVLYAVISWVIDQNQTGAKTVELGKFQTYIYKRI